MSFLTSGRGDPARSEASGGEGAALSTAGARVAQLLPD
jgi:hypothetical protein